MNRCGIRQQRCSTGYSTAYSVNQHLEGWSSSRGLFLLSNDAAEALEAGRSIVAYFATTATIAKVEGLFTNAGLTKVKTF